MASAAKARSLVVLTRVEKPLYNSPISSLESYSNFTSTLPSATSFEIPTSVSMEFVILRTFQNAGTSVSARARIVTRMKFIALLLALSFRLIFEKDISTYPNLLSPASNIGAHDLRMSSVSTKTISLSDSICFFSFLLLFNPVIYSIFSLNTRTLEIAISSSFDCSTARLCWSDAPSSRIIACIPRDRFSTKSCVINSASFCRVFFARLFAS